MIKGIVIPVSSIKHKTGYLWDQPFLIPSPNKIAFYDAMLSEISNERPEEAVSRYWEVDTVTGEVKVEIVAREKVDGEKFKEEKKAENFSSNININPISKGKAYFWNIFKPASTYKSQIYMIPGQFKKSPNSGIGTRRAEYIDEDLVVNTNEDTVYGDESTCHAGMLDFLIPCMWWQENTISFDSKKYGTYFEYKNGRIDYFTIKGADYAPVRTETPFILKVSRDEDIVAFFKAGYYFMDMKEGKIVKILNNEMNILEIR